METNEERVLARCSPSGAQHPTSQCYTSRGAWRPPGSYSGESMGYLSTKTIALGMIALLMSCSPERNPATATPTALAPTPSLTPTPTFTSLFPPVRTEAPTGTVAAETSPGGDYVQVSADNVNLRTGPGTVFPVSRLLARGTRLQVQGHAPGGEWLYVRTDANINGWVLNWLVSGGQDGGTTPLVEPEGVQVIQGAVVDQAGVPISGIGFAVTQGSGPNVPRTDATTDSAGRFYAYVPASASGTWYVTYVSVSCTSNTMDARCNCIGTCGKADPERVSVQLPAQQTLQFIWK